MNGLALVHVDSDENGNALISFRSGAGVRPRAWLRRWGRGGRLGRLMQVSPRLHAVGFHHALATDRDGPACAWKRR
jgi:hypothetical protein